MFTSSRLVRSFAAVLAAGGFCWVVKFVVIAASGGATTGLPDTATAVLYVGAVVLMAIGMVGLGIALLAGRPVLVRALGGAAGLLALFATYSALDAVAKGIAGTTDPAWLADEIGIVVTGALLMTLGLLLTRRRDASRATTPA